MVQSHFTSDQRYPYTFERQHDRMARKEPARQSPATYVTPPPSTDAAPAHAGYNATPRSYSHQVPTMTQAVSSGEVGEVQPWIYQLFPESYAEVPGAGYHGPVVDGPYVQAGGPENGLVYSQAGTTRPTLSSSPLHSHDERYHYSAPSTWPFFSLLPSPFSLFLIFQLSLCLACVRCKRECPPHSLSCRRQCTPITRSALTEFHANVHNLPQLRHGKSNHSTNHMKTLALRTNTIGMQPSPYPHQ